MGEHHRRSIDDRLLQRVNIVVLVRKNQPLLV